MGAICSRLLSSKEWQEQLLTVASNVSDFEQKIEEQKSERVKSEREMSEEGMSERANSLPCNAYIFAVSSTPQHYPQSICSFEQ